MPFIVNDFKCTKCEHVQEFIYNPKESLETTCEECGSKEMVKIYSAGTGDKKHFSWAKWRA